MTSLDLSGVVATGADPMQTSMANVIAWARREQRVSVRLLLERMDMPLSAPRYVRFEAGRRTLPDEVMASICRALDIDLSQVAADAAMALTDKGPPVVDEAMVPLQLRGSGPQVPAIRVRVERMMSGEQTWLQPVRGMLGLHAANGTDSNGDLLLEEPLIRTIAQISGRTLFECWVGLSTFIEHDSAANTG
ncbi:helix-turn-helix domain-containing protein [Nakamurella sp. PAMC28650]|uniref:helix-turn-helix domain-containing protein n=1 Tax=Nakamurella sp. PAMC28650 TaxID=2762325 RepID=UPI00164DBB80|nr:hypothetical protein [Nakamurella sp. PAMC28650]QNK82135.1 hypothetical protein H7F38_05110 [Nakamurella sp. PAMC28650]